MEQQKSPAPALERGLNILRFLESHSDVTLEAIAQHEQVPKSSILRLLDVLINQGLVVKQHQTKTYKAAARIVFLQEFDPVDRDFLLQEMQALRDRTNYTIEWFVPAENGMVLIERVYPEDQMVFVRAKIGFVRLWNGELDAVAALGHGFFRKPAADCRTFWCYDESAERVDLTEKEAKAFLEDSHSAKLAVDINTNANGVRRIAALVQKNGKPSGILSVAKTAFPKGGVPIEPIKEELRKITKRLTT